MRSGEHNQGKAGLQKRKGISCREIEKKTKEETNRKRGEDWSVVALYLPINQHHLSGLGLSSYVHARTHARPFVSNIIKCPVGRVSDYKVPNWVFGQ